MNPLLNRRQLLALSALPLAGAAPNTVVTIRGDGFAINGAPTYPGRTYQGRKIEGLLMNARMVQAIFDDANPQTRSRWAYPDTKRWSAARNTREFLAAMPIWRKHGLLAVTINLQGGSPEGYSKAQPWINSAINPDGSLNRKYMDRLSTIIDRADSLGMVVILGCYYFGQDERIKDETAVRQGVGNTVRWVLDHGWQNVLLEIDNECNVKSYDHEILKPARVHELIEMAKRIERNGRRLLVGTSYGGNAIPTPNVVPVSDFLLIHGNGVADPNRIAEMVRQTRAVPGYKPMPILFNEDDHFDFDKPKNNMLSALDEYSSWGYFDPGLSNYKDGYQCPPVNWGMSSPRKEAFFKLLLEVTGG